MTKTITGIIVTIIALLLWGALYWGASPLPNSGLKQAADDAAAQQVLKEHFPESGTYYIPGADNESAARTAMYEQGPAGFVHVRHGHKSFMGPATIIGGLVLNLVVVGLLVAFFKVAGAKEMRDFTRLSATAGAVAAIAINGNDMIWWSIAVEWKIWQLIYDYSVWLIAGHILAFFMKEEAA